MDSAHYDLRLTTGAGTLNVGDVHVWRICLDQDVSYVNALFGELSPDEQQKACNYRIDTDRNRFIVARGALRRILAGYVSCGPEQVCFSYNRYGKPFLEQNPYRFNITHSRGLGLIAVTTRQEIGVDVEFIDESFEILKTARSFFSPTEFFELQAIEPSMQTAAFFRCWTHKEAYLKAIGVGFSYPEKSFYYQGDCSESHTLFRAASRGKGRVWTLIDLPIDQNYKAAMAVQGKIGTIQYYQIGTE